MHQKSEQMYYYGSMALPLTSSSLDATPHQPSTKLPLKAEYAALLSQGGLSVGTVTKVSGPGSYTAMIEMLSVTSQAGYNIAFAGLHDLGVVSLARAGWDLSRVILVDDGSETMQIIALLVAAFDVVVFDATVVDRSWHRLVARAREHKSALVILDRQRTIENHQLRRSPPGVTLVVEELGWSVSTPESPLGSPTLRIVVQEHGLAVGVATVATR
ncbi:hypothetical protein [Ferrimicrobium sp.]|uniref:hypothetical protein n=1 Tax=Ferrimicrobium sp. TaxID=2926050 RepID=UPI0026331C72|nr:hypothetical protein [Ferrimicrobium sp.]